MNTINLTATSFFSRSFKGLFGWSIILGAALAIGTGCAASEDPTSDDDTGEETVESTSDELKRAVSPAQCNSACARQGFRCGGRVSKEERNTTGICYCNYGKNCEPRSREKPSF